eukprot:4428719-Pyramimonas_sp.AAC.1
MRGSRAPGRRRLSSGGNGWIRISSKEEEECFGGRRSLRDGSLMGLVWTGPQRGLSTRWRPSWN